MAASAAATRTGILAGTALATASMPAGAASLPMAPSASGPSLHVTPRGRITELAIDPKHTAIIYAGTDTAGIYRSTNGGATWTTESKGLPAGTPIAALTVTTQETLFAATPCISSLIRSLPSS